MTFSKTIWRPALAAAALVSLSACATAATDEASTRVALAPGDCFSTTQWRGWSSPSEDVLYLRVRNHDVYKVDLLPAGRIEGGGRFLISEAAGSTRVCSANDLRLWVSDSVGFRSPVFPKAISMLTPEEIAALPKEARP